MSTQVAFAANAGHKRYIARGKNQLHTIFEKHFSEFCDQYEERFAQKYGRFRLRRIESVAGRFGTCTRLPPLRSSVRGLPRQSRDRSDPESRANQKDPEPPGENRSGTAGTRSWGERTRHLVGLSGDIYVVEVAYTSAGSSTSNRSDMAHSYDLASAATTDTGSPVSGAPIPSVFTTTFGRSAAKDSTSAPHVVRNERFYSPSTSLRRCF